MIEGQDLIRAIVMLGLPLVVLSWVVFSWLFVSGDISTQDDHEAITKKLKELKKLDKSLRRGVGGKKNFLLDKWMWFGSGFYGMAGFWTLIVIEISEVIGLFMNPVLDVESSPRGIVEVVVDFFMNQLGNIIQAFVWFSYWPADSMLVWVLIAYLGYWLGVELAKHQKIPSPAVLLKTLLPGWRHLD